MDNSNDIKRLLDLNGVHPQWRAPLTRALARLEPGYLEELLNQPDWLPGPARLLAAFRRDRAGCRYLLFGESPYPRAASANGIAFQDAAVTSLWSESGLSKAVNRATSLRNLLKTALIAEGLIQPMPDGSVPQSRIAALDKSGLTASLDELFQRLEACGVLAFNALPVLRDGHSKAREARRWEGFLDRLLEELRDDDITLILWGRIAERILALPGARGHAVLQAEHPYNLGFIHNPEMQALFARWRLLHREASDAPR